MTSEELINVIENEHAIQYSNYPDTVKTMILNYFELFYYKSHSYNEEFLAAFCFWPNIKDEDKPFLINIIDIYKILISEAEVVKILSENDNINMFKILSLLNSMSFEKRIVFVQKFFNTLKK